MTSFLFSSLEILDCFCWFFSNNCFPFADDNLLQLHVVGAKRSRNWIFLKKKICIIFVTNRVRERLISSDIIHRRVPNYNTKSNKKWHVLTKTTLRKSCDPSWLLDFFPESELSKILSARANIKNLTIPNILLQV